MIAETAAIAPQGPRSEILAALKSASAQTGSDFDYLLSTAQRESGLDSSAKSKTSSATGLFQFIDQTWLSLVKRYGERHGLGAYASAIETGSNGHLQVASADAKAAILALRQNPTLSALMAGEAACETRESLEGALGRDVCAGELYAAHFLGPNGACQLIRLNESDPDARADLAFPQAAKANRGVFYRADGTPKTVSEVYAWAVDLPAAKKGGAAAAPKRGVLAAASQRPSAGRVLANDLDWSPRPTVQGDEISRAFQAHHAYRTPKSFVGTAAALATRGFPNPPLLLNAGVMEILAQLAPANLRRAG